MEYTGLVTYAGLTDLEFEAKSAIASLTSLEAPALGNFANFTDLTYGNLSTVALLASLEKEEESSLALITQTEKEEVVTVANITTLEQEVLSTLALLSSLEKETKSLFALLTQLERDFYASFASKTILEKVIKVPVALLTDLVYYEVPPVVIERLAPEITDKRAEGPSNPVVIVKMTLQITAGELAMSTRFRLNTVIHQAVILVPALAAETAKLELIDELGGVLYDSSTLTESGTRVKNLGASPVLLSGLTTATVTITGAQSVSKTFTVFLYGA